VLSTDHRQGGLGLRQGYEHLVEGLKPVADLVEGSRLPVVDIRVPELVRILAADSASVMLYLKESGGQSCGWRRGVIPSGRNS